MNNTLLNSKHRNMLFQPNISLYVTVVYVIMFLFIQFLHLAFSLKKLILNISYILNKIFMFNSFS